MENMGKDQHISHHRAHNRNMAFDFGIKLVPWLRLQDRALQSYRSLRNSVYARHHDTLYVGCTWLHMVVLGSCSPLKHRSPFGTLPKAGSSCLWSTRDRHEGRRRRWLSQGQRRSNRWEQHWMITSSQEMKFRHISDSLSWVLPWIAFFPNSMPQNISYH